MSALMLDLTTEEAWYVSHKPWDEEFPKWRISDRGTTEFRDLMRSLSGQGVTFTCGGDPIVFAKITEVLAPWDYRDEWHGKEKTENLWTMEADGATWRRIPPDNTSYWQHRIADDVDEDFCLAERALAEEWKKENEENPGVNSNVGLLQALMLSTLQHEKPEGFIPWLTNRERKIVATVIQWLGTNCGRSFLYEASKRMGRPHYPFTLKP